MDDATGTAPTGVRVHIDTRSGWICDADLARADAVALFETEGEVLAGRGRGAIRVVAAARGRVVLRHYRRGGFAAKLSRDWFLWTGAESTRAFREFRLTRQLRAAGLPVPVVVAARYQRFGLGYRADLATREIVGARTLAERLAEVGDRATIDWAALGTLLGAFHAVGLWHADLNAHNILYDGDGRALLIDFDRARLLTPFATVLQGNLDRLARSLRKLGHGGVVSGPAWSELHRAYDAATHRHPGSR
ncbi:MAG: 3-deoxy-D-manno-octulosonic acid kinase [Xanthomonadales bacterium]|nr:3-deoxy-D-manno-octulosonic acid kinase [Xanthomonadales bacterium]MBK7144806.1 3-deoxy-D-manno-octulosonic acid kinase [Xanthomonadales bacterium]MCC6562397.1 3-deoxy-D-manno-octulosonic acid kinase [Xanthomonadales bacterium]